MKILTIGGATQDIFIHHRNAERLILSSDAGEKSFLLLKEGSKIEVTHLDYSTGGGATNSAVSFKRLDFDVAPCFKVGNDHQAQLILDALQKEGIVTSYVVHTDTAQTGISFIIPSPTGDRTVFAFRGANAYLTYQDVPQKYLKDYDCIYITSLSEQSSQLLPSLTIQAKKLGIVVANNPGASQLASGAHTLREALPNIDILILNSEEANQFMVALMHNHETLEESEQKILTNTNAPELLKRPITYKNICFSLKTYFKEVLAQGPKIVVVTNGAEGVYVATKDVILFHPSLPTKINNTVGAGDAFGSCFVACLTKKLSVEESLVRGIINATSVISYLDAKEGLLAWQDLEKKAHALGLGLIKKFKL